MKLALAQINPTVGDFTGNTRKIIEFSIRAAGLGAHLVVFPELSVCGYPPADFLEKEAFVERAGQAVEEIAAATADLQLAVLCGTVTPVQSAMGTHAESKRVRNTAVILIGGRVIFSQHKMLLPFYDVFDEQRYFEPAHTQKLFELGGVTLAITVCEDAWNDKAFWPRRVYDTDPVEELMHQAEGTAGAPKQIGLEIGLGHSPEHGLEQTGSVHAGSVQTAPAQTGSAKETRPLILNISASPYWKGKRQVRREMLAALARRHGAGVAMVNQVGGNDSLVFDGSSLALAADGRVMAQARSFAEDLVLVDTDALTTPAASAVNPGLLAATLTAPDVEPVEDIAATYDALVLGVSDYVHKCGFAKVLVGLSGGIDSALVAAIAVDALGAANVRGIGMPSQYSSAGSLEDSRALAEHLGIRYDVLPIHGVLEQFMATLEAQFAGTPFGLAEENLQSRIRGSLLMALSNKFNALVLTTGNKSEMSTGYCTLYGDMVGALAVIGDVVKTRVYAVARYVNREREIIPVATLEKAPSAELRPDQKDTDSLPPYEVLDPILEAYIERYESADEIAGAQGVDPRLVRQVLQLVERSEYKRQQAAPVLKVTQKSFGMGRRFPIAVKVQV